MDTQTSKNALPNIPECRQLPRTTDQHRQGLGSCSQLQRRAPGQNGNAALVTFTAGAPQNADFCSAAVAKGEQKLFQPFSSK